MSFLSIEPQSRVVLESHSDRLLDQFDTQLKIIADRYLDFFRERRRIEATYIESLRKLHHKAKSVDASIDQHAEPTTMRAAWEHMRDNLERGVVEADTQQTFVDILDNDVIKPLTALKGSKAETRKRIEEDLKISAAKYADHAEITIAKLQRAYLRKYHPRIGKGSAASHGGGKADLWEPETTKSEEVFDDKLRGAVRRLNIFRSMRTENLSDGYDCLEGLVFMPTVKDILVNYMGGKITVCGNYHNLEICTKAKVEKALAGTDTSDLRASFRQSLAFSIPPPTLYRIHRPGAYSELIFGVPLVDVAMKEDNVPKVMRLCIEEVEKRGLDTKKIYSVGHPCNAEILQLRRRFERERAFSLSSVDDIHSVAMLLLLYIWELPEPLFSLSMEDYRSYRQKRAGHARDDFSLLRSKIRELHPVHKATLGALFRHLLFVASHSEKNATTLEALSFQFRYAVLRGDAVIQDEVHGLVLEDLIRNAYALFDGRPRSSPYPPVSSSDAENTTFAYTQGSMLMSPELSEPAEDQDIYFSAKHRPRHISGASTSTQLYFSSFPSDPAMEGRTTPSSTYLSPLLFSSSNPLTETTDTTTQEHATPEANLTDTKALPNRTQPEVGLPPGRSVAEWRLQVSQSDPSALTTPQSPSESVVSGTITSHLSSATSLQSGIFSP
ncbi:hypothetical protein EI94DRAFT_1821835 [Lactarius quietus]|nr:hypothetical protein EI94DRAFT_1821835 [Lactarius quietus]